jgi:2-keto-4-pentenoate hydratase
MINKTLSLFLVVVSVNFSVVSHAQKLDLNIEVNQKILAESFIVNFNEAIPIPPIRAGDISEKVAYQIADLYVAELIKQEGEYDNGPVNGLAGPVTAVMFSKSIHNSGAHISVDCCNMSFVEADFAAEVKSDAINNAETDLEILAALSGFRPFIEMPDILQPLGSDSNVGGIATNYDVRNAIIGDLIKSRATPEWIKRLNNFSFQMTNEKDELLAEGSIKDAYEPIYRVRHLRDQLLKRGRPLQEGDLLSLGNMGAIRPLKPNLYFDATIRPVFRGNIATVSYIGLDPKGTAKVSVVIDRLSD